MSKLRWSIFSIGVFSCFLLVSASIAGTYTAKVTPMAENSVLRVLYYGGIKGNIAPCG